MVVDEVGGGGGGGDSTASDVYRGTTVQHTIQYGSPRKGVKDTEVR